MFLRWIGLGLLLGIGTQAQAVPILFSGGNGTPLTITVPTPITYTVTNNTNDNILFVLRATGNPLSGSAAGTGLSFTVDGGATQFIDISLRASSPPAISVNDMVVYNDNSVYIVTIGDTIVLSAGTFTTASTISGAAPADGDYLTYLASTAGRQFSTTGTTVPEPETYAAVCGAAGLLAAGCFRRRAAGRCTIAAQ
jgi:hypothetical protein